MPLEVILIGVVAFWFAILVALKFLPLRVSVPFMLVAVAIMVAAGLTEYSVRKGYCNQMGADITSVRRQLWCTNGVKTAAGRLGALVGLLSETLERIGDGERIVGVAFALASARVRATYAARRTATSRRASAAMAAFARSR